jgi:hypothetical protein
MKITPAPVIGLLHRAIYSTLATQSVKFSGYPYATVIPNIVDAHQQPILLISLLAEHTKNLLADHRISLSITDPGIGNIQEGARLTMVGDAEPFEADAAMTARYLRYLPEAEQYLPLDFRFFRVIPKHLRYIAGIGQMGWLEAEEWTRLPALSPDDEEALIALAASAVANGVTVLGIDRFGMDYRSADGRRRVALEPEADLKAQILAVAPTLSVEALS